MDFNELLELNARLSAKVFDLEDKLAESKECTVHYYNKCVEYEKKENKNDAI